MKRLRLPALILATVGGLVLALAATVRRQGASAAPEPPAGKASPTRTSSPLGAGAPLDEAGPQSPTSPDGQPSNLVLVGGPWSGSRVGTLVKRTFAKDRMTQVLEVVRVEADAVVLRMSLSKPAARPSESRMPTQWEEGRLAREMGTKVGEETLSVGGKDLRCEVYERHSQPRERAVTLRAWVCKDVPCWFVRTDLVSEEGATTLTVGRLWASSLASRLMRSFRANSTSSSSVNGFCT